MKIPKFTKHPLFSGSVIMIAGSMVVNVINYFYHLIMGRILGPVDYGILASLYSILYMVSIVPFSTSFAIVKFISSAETEEKGYGIYNTLNKFIFKTALILSVVLLLFTPALSRFLNIYSIWETSLVAPILFFSLITLVNQATMQGLLKFTGVVAPNILSAVGKLVFGLFLIFLGFRVLGAMGGVFIAAVLAYFLSARLILPYVKKNSGESFKIKRFLKFSFPVLLQAVAFTSIFTIDVILVKHFFPPFEAGIYAALSMLGKIIFFAASPVTSVMFPIISGRSTKGDNYRKVLLLSFAITFLICLGGMTVYFLFPKLAIVILYGSKYLSAIELLGLMGVFLSLYTLNYFVSNFFLSIGKVWVAYLPLFAAVLQAVFIWFFHGSLFVIIQISLGLMIILFLVLGPLLIYNVAYGKSAKK